MKKWLNRLDRKLEGISRQKKTAVYLTLCALLLLLIWTRFGCPLPTAELEFRRYERTHLLPRSELVLRSDREYITAADGTQLYLYEDNFVGLSGDWATVANIDDFSAISCRTLRLEEGPALVLLEGEPYGGWSEEVPSGTPYRDHELEHHHFSPALLVNVPRETARAEIDVGADGDLVEGRSCWDLGGGVWLLGVEDTYAVFAHPGSLRPYTLRLYRGDGSLLLEKSGMLGEG